MHVIPLSVPYSGAHGAVQLTAELQVCREWETPGIFSLSWNKPDFFIKSNHGAGNVCFDLPWVVTRLIVGFPPPSSVVEGGVKVVA